MEEALVNRLLGTAGLTALVGSLINWAARPQTSSLPAVVLHRIDGIPDYVNAGPSGLVNSRVQIDCWGRTYLEAKQVARQVHASLSGMTASVDDGNSPAAVTNFMGSFAEGERDSFETEAGSKQIYRTSLDYILWHGTG